LNSLDIYCVQVSFLLSVFQTKGLVVATFDNLLLHTPELDVALQAGPNHAPNHLSKQSATQYNQLPALCM
jgi:hypothetical protein